MFTKGSRWLLSILLMTLCLALAVSAQAAPTFQINLPSESTKLNVGDTNVKISYTVTASADADPALIFASDNTSVVTVNAGTGELTAVGVGYANITIEHPTEPKFTTVHKVEVISTSTLTLDMYSAVLPVGGTITLTYHTNAPLPITFSSSNVSVCTVDNTGKVTALKDGTAEILVANSHGIKATCTIQVGTGSGSSPSPSTPDPAPSTGYTAYVNTAIGGLNLRAAQTTDSIILRTIPQNAAFTVLEYGPVWCKAWYNGTTGYVMTQFVRFADTTPSTPSTPSTPTVPAEGITAYVNTVSGSLNLRAGKSTAHAVLRTIPQNAAFTLLEYGANWCKVYYNGTTGYVMTQFVYIPGGSPAVPVTPSTPSTPSIPSTVQFLARVYTPSGSLNLRVAPSQSSSRIILIPRNAIVDVLSFATDWSYVRYGMHEGYVMSKFLNMDTSSIAPEPSTPSYSVTSYAQVITVQGGLNLRKSASTGSKRILVIPQYAFVEVKEAGTKWSYVTYNGTSGYVQSKYLKMI